METLEFTKVYENRNQRFYKLSKPVTKVANPNYNWEQEIKLANKRINPKYLHLLTKEIEYVCVSDAHTHIERLLFVAIPANEEKTSYGSLGGLQIDGKHTMMMRGGNKREVHPDEVYLRRLASANNLRYNQ